MAKQIKNRREDLYINEVPPEILTEKKLSDDGFVKNTDYATSSVGGVIKASSTYGVYISQGTLLGTTRTLEQYEANTAGNMIISKGTLENVFAELIQKYIKAIFLANVMEPDTTKEYAVTMGYSEVLHEWNLEFEEL